ncbi:macrophage mannose receptor 1-like [Vanacampus margaritifer]
MAFALRSLFLLCGISGLLTGVWSFPTKILQDVSCPEGWTQVDCKCYIYQGEMRTFAAAEAVCNILGGNLVSIHSDLECAVVQQLVLANTASLGAWIGLHEAIVRCYYIRDALWALRSTGDTPPPDLPEEIRRADPGKCRRRRGQRGGARQRLQKRGYRPALPSLLLGNVRSLKSKLDELRSLTSACREHRDACAMVFTETWFHSDIPDSLCEVEGFSLIRADRTEPSGKSRGGGVCTYINDNWCRNYAVRLTTCTPDESSLSSSVANIVTAKMAFLLRSLFLLCGISGLLTGVWSFPTKILKDVSCPEGWTQVDCKCYIYQGEMRSFADAEAVCNILGGNLVSIHSDLECAVVQQLFLANTGSPGAWIGLHEAIADNDDFIWTDGTVEDFLNFDPADSDTGDCVEMILDSGLWETADCADLEEYICNKDAHPLFL